ncbi:MAG: hypothetical protein ACRCSS_18400 [Shewanella sp.]
MVFKAIWKPLAITSLVALSLWGLSAWRYSAGKEAGELVANQQWQVAGVSVMPLMQANGLPVRRRCVSLKINGRKI